MQEVRLKHYPSKDALFKDAVRLFKGEPDRQTKRLELVNGLARGLKESRKQLDDFRSCFVHSDIVFNVCKNADGVLVDHPYKTSLGHKLGMDMDLLKTDVKFWQELLLILQKEYRKEQQAH